MLLRATALPAAALSTTFLLTSVIDQRGSLIFDPRKISTVPIFLDSRKDAPDKPLCLEKRQPSFLKLKSQQGKP